MTEEQRSVEYLVICSGCKVASAARVRMESDGSDTTITGDCSVCDDPLSQGTTVTQLGRVD